jgi:hypothetical protein
MLNNVFWLHHNLVTALTKRTTLRRDKFAFLSMLLKLVHLHYVLASHMGQVARPAFFARDVLHTQLSTVELLVATRGTLLNLG